MTGARARAVRRAAALMLLAGAPSALGDVSPGPPLETARLEGFFEMNGVVTRAVGVPGEHRGQSVQRIWAFIPSCPSGPCPTVQLVRQRAGGLDTLSLIQSGPAVYTGNGGFAVPARCHGRRYDPGTLVLYTITVRITAAAAVGTGVSATQLRAHYRNVGRIGLTKCFSAPSYDSANYISAPVAAGAIRRPASTRSSTGS